MINKSYIGGSKLFLKLHSKFIKKNFRNITKINSKCFFNSCSRYSLKEIFNYYNGFKNIIFFSPRYICDSVKFHDKNTKSFEYNSFNDLSKKIKNNQKSKIIILIVNYFGILHIDKILYELRLLHNDLIIINDLCHSFPTVKSINKSLVYSDFTLVSFRKFLPVHNGSAVFTNNKFADDIFLNSKITKESMFNFAFRGKFLNYILQLSGLKYKLQKIIFKNIKPGILSSYSIRIFNEAKLHELNEIRKINFMKYLKHFNVPIVNMMYPKYYRNANPLYFPLKVDKPFLLQIYLIKYNIFCPIYWQDSDSDDILLGLPIDDTCSEKDVSFVINHIKKFFLEERLSNVL